MEVLLDSKPSSSSMPAQQIKITCTQCLLTSKSTLPGGKSTDKEKPFMTSILLTFYHIEKDCKFSAKKNHKMLKHATAMLMLFEKKTTQ